MILNTVNVNPSFFRTMFKMQPLHLPFQMHPLGLCNNNDEEDLYEYGWVGVVKLEQPELDPSCLTVLGKVKRTRLLLWLT